MGCAPLHVTGMLGLRNGEQQLEAAGTWRRNRNQGAARLPQAGWSIGIVRQTGNWRELSVYIPELNCCLSRAAGAISYRKSSTPPWRANRSTRAFGLDQFVRNSELRAVGSRAAVRRASSFCEGGWEPNLLAELGPELRMRHDQRRFEQIGNVTTAVRHPLQATRPVRVGQLCREMASCL